MTSTNCPSREDLFACLVGTLPEQTADAVIDHVAGCPDCQTTLAAFDETNDTLVAQLRVPAPANPYQDEPQCQAAMSRAKAAVGKPVPAAAEPQAGAALPELSFSGVKAGPARVPRRLGEYQLLEKLGQGGMGAVFKARHTKLKRIVALKVLAKGRMQDQRAIARFEREMAAVGQLDHPNIVRAHDARKVGKMRFLVMEFVDGLDLSQLVQRLGPLPIADACEVIRLAALGLQAAHNRQLVHRDMKPSNLMLSHQGQVKLLDLGLARILSEVHNPEEATDTGQVMGTADYIAPEQVGDSHSVDIRADIYSLGCTLYKLLCGQAPFSGPEYGNTFKKMQAHVNEPVPTIGQFRADVPELLAEVLGRMLAKDPNDRYSTPAEAAEAMGCFATGADLATLVAKAAGRPVPPPLKSHGRASTQDDVSLPKVDTQVERRPRPARLLTRLAQRRWQTREIVVGLSAVAALLVLGIVIRIATDKGEVVIDPVVAGAELIVERGGKEVGRIKVGQDAKRITLRSGDYQITLDGTETDELYVENGKFTLTRGGKTVVQVRRKETVPPPGDSPETRVRTLTGHTGKIQSLAFSPDGATLASGSWDRTIKTWDLVTGQLRYSVDAKTEHTQALTFSKDGKRLIGSSTSGLASGRTGIWEAATGDHERTLGHHHHWLTSVALNADGSTMASTGRDGDLRLWDTRTWKALWTVDTKTPIDGKEGSDWPLSVDFSPDGSTLATGHRNYTVRLWDAKTGTLRNTLAGHKGWVDSVAFIPGGSHLVSGCDDGTMRLWDTQSGRLLKTIDSQSGKVFSVAVSPDGSTIASANSDVTVRLWDAATGQLRRTLSGHGLAVNCVAFSPDGSLLASGSVDGAIKLWDLRAGKSLGRAQADGWESIFDGESLDGWEAYPNPRSWSVREGAIRGQGGSSYLLYPEPAGDFELRAEVKINQPGDSGICFHARKGPNGKTIVGEQVQILGSSAQWAKGWSAFTGSYLGGRLVTENHIKDDQWFTLHVAVREGDVMAWIDGRQVLYQRRNPRFSRGPDCLALQVWGRNTEVSFRQIAVRQLGADQVWDVRAESTAESSNPDRRAAEWVLGIGGWVRIIPQGEDISRLADLPDEPFQVVHINLWNKPELTNDSLRHLEGLTALRGLEMPGNPQIGPTGAKYLASLKRLEYLDLNDNQLGDEGLQCLTGLENLQILSLWSTGVTDAGLGQLRKMAGLLGLNLGRNKITGKGLAQLQELSLLRSLTLLVTQVGDDDLKLLAAFPKLRDLDLSNTPVTDAGLPHLLTLRELEVLHLNCLLITDAGMAELGKLNNDVLHDLELGGTRITDQGLKHLSPFRLRFLQLHDTAIEGPGLEHLQAGTLTTLCLRRTPVGDEGVKYLAGMSNLTNLLLEDTAVTDDAMEVIGGQQKLEGLGLSGTAITDAGLEKLKGLKNLTQLLLNDTQVTDAGVARLQAALPDCQISRDKAASEADELPDNNP